MQEQANKPVEDATEREFSHPLRIIPWFRKLPVTLWIDALLTAVFSVVLGAMFSVVGHFPKTITEFGQRFLGSLVFAFSMGYSIHLISRVFVPTIRMRLRKHSFTARLFADAAVWFGGGMMGIGIASVLLKQPFGREGYTIYAVLGGTVLMSVIFGVALRQQAVLEIKAERERAERSETQRTLAVSRLRLLQAQIEPHFLFNTLANVSSLIEHDPKQARKMLDQFTLLLRASLDQTRKDTTTVRAELQVVEAYLAVLKVRMGERLDYKVDSPPNLLKIEVPTMLLQPIVENAVKHGIEPRMKGGTVLVDVQHEGSQLVFSVSDNGVGFVGKSTENIGLGAVRERLAVQFGDAASLTTERTPEDWTRVTIRIPMPA